MNLSKNVQAVVVQVIYGVLCCGCLLSAAQAADAFSGYYGGNGNGQVKPNGVMHRDPFTTSNKMYGEVGVQNALKAGGGQGFIPGYGNQTVPKMKVKGFVNNGGKKAVALLDIEGVGVYLVSKGDEIGLQALGQNTVLKILGVDSNSIKVQSGMINQVIIVR